MPVTCISSTGRLRFEPTAAAARQAAFTGQATPCPPDEIVEAPSTVAIPARYEKDVFTVLTFLSLFGLLQAVVLAPPLLLADTLLR